MNKELIKIILILALWAFGMSLDAYWLGII